MRLLYSCGMVWKRTEKVVGRDGGPLGRSGRSVGRSNAFTLWPHLPACLPNVLTYAHGTLPPDQLIYPAALSFSSVCFFLLSFSSFVLLLYSLFCIDGPHDVDELRVLFLILLLTLL